MSHGPSFLPPPPWRLQRVVPEAHCRWWLLLDGDYALLVETLWQDEQPRLHLDTPPFKPGDLCDDPLTQIYLGHLRVVLSTNAAAFYRPMKACLPTLPDLPATPDQILRTYGIDSTVLAALQARYAVHLPLLHRRLLDLALALRQALGLCGSGLIQLLHWQWHSPSRRTATIWPTPLAAILDGALAQVEATLYPHAAGGGWTWTLAPEEQR